MYRSMKLTLTLALALVLAPSVWGQSQVVCTTSSPGTVIGACGGTSDPLSLANIVGTTAVCSVGAPDTANSVCVSANAITGEGSSADASETIIAFGNATADQTLTCTGAASSLGCVVASPAVPVNGATAGNSLALTASPAIPNAGAGTDGAAAGGSVTITAGDAARDTSGNANGGDVVLATGAGIGTGTAGQVKVPNGTAAKPAIAISGTGNYIHGLYYNTDFTAPGIAYAGAPAASFSATRLNIRSDAQLGWTTTTSLNTNPDTGIGRSSAGVVKITDGSTGNGALLVGAGTGTGTLTVGGVLCKGVGIATAGTSEEALATCAIPAATLTANGASLRITLVAHTAANGNNKQLRIRVGGVAGTLVHDSTAAAMNNVNLALYGPVVVTRTSATAATSHGVIYSIAADATAGATTTRAGFVARAAAITWANALDLVITGTTPTAAGDLTLDSYVVEVVQ